MIFAVKFLESGFAISLFEQPSEIEVLARKENGKLIRSNRVVMKLTLPHKNKS
jgi:hypothetical protein